MIPCKTIPRLILTAIPFFIAFSCQPEKADVPSGQGGLSFRPVVTNFLDPADSAGTRATPVSSMYDTFDISAYAFTGSWSGQNKPNLFYRETMTRNGDSWSGSARMVWPGSGYSVRFAAVSPSTATGLSWISTATDGGMPQISFTVQDNAADQLDLLEAVSSDYAGTGDDSGYGVNLTFNHILTAIRFRIKDVGIEGTLKSITLSGIRNTGRHVVGSGTWTGQSGSATYAVACHDMVFPASGDILVTESSNTLLLMPQTLGNDALLTIEIVTAGTEKTLTASLAGESWLPGKLVTYTLNPSANDWLYSTVSISGVPATIENGVQTAVATVSSYRQHALGFSQPLAWSMTFSEDGNTFSPTPPSWLSISPTSGDGGKTGTVINATVTRVNSKAEYRCTVKVSNGGNDNRFDIVLPTPRFAGLEIAPAPLYYNGSSFEIKDADWNHESYNVKQGKVAGSYYFMFTELASYFDSRGSSFSATSSGDIDNANTITYNGHNDWRLPTSNEWKAMTTGSRTGSKVNGATGKKYAIIQLTGVTHAGSSTPIGLLIAPDGLILTGMRTLTWNSTAVTTGVTVSELNAYLEVGCAFLPSSGDYGKPSSSWVWEFGGKRAYYHSARGTRDNGTSSNTTYWMAAFEGYLEPLSGASKTAYYLPARLVR
jgi:hypothetical protein